MTFKTYVATAAAAPDPDDDSCPTLVAADRCCTHARSAKCRGRRPRARRKWSTPCGDRYGHLLADAATSDLIDALRAVAASTEAEKTDFVLMAQRYAEIGIAIQDLVVGISDFANGLQAALNPAGDYVKRTDIVNQLPRSLLDLLVVQAVGEVAPQLFAVLSVFGIFTRRPVVADPPNYGVAHVRAGVEWDRFGTLFSNPRQLFVDEYGWDTVAFDARSLLSNFTKTSAADLASTHDHESQS
jgi:hypothetical protein